MRLLVFDGDEATAQQAAELIASKARDAIAARGRACLALSGGRTPWIMMRALAAQELSWRDVHIFQADERVAPLGSADRTLTHLREALLSLTPLRPEQVHPMPVDDDDLVAAAQRYEATLKQVAGTPPVLDLVHLGLGPDGHTASLVPNDPALEVTAADVTISGPYQGHRRMTLTYPILNRAETVLWLVTGAGKAEALKRLYTGDTSIPAGRVRRDRAIILADKLAASLLPEDADEDSNATSSGPSN
ncbi:MAG: 6-phosphogluconolactonase [Rhodoplanes sp.]